MKFTDAIRNEMQVAVQLWTNIHQVHFDTSVSDDEKFAPHDLKISTNPVSAINPDPETFLNKLLLRSSASNKKLVTESEFEHLQKNSHESCVDPLRLIAVLHNFYVYFDAKC